MFKFISLNNYPADLYYEDRRLNKEYYDSYNKPKH